MPSSTQSPASLLALSLCTCRPHILVRGLMAHGVAEALLNAPQVRRGHPATGMWWAAES